MDGEMNMKRLPELDMIKGVGVFFMIVLHVYVWWWAVDDFKAPVVRPQEGLEWLFFLKMIGFFVFMIPITAGAAFYNYSKKSNGSFFDTAKRSLLLLIVGFVINVLAFGPDDLLSWDVLHFIALSFIVVWMLVRLPIALLFLSSILALFGAYIIRPLFAPIDASFLTVILVGNSSGSYYWAFFPWFSFVLFGYAFMRLIQEGKMTRRMQNLFVYASLLCILVSILRDEFVIKLDLENIWGPAIFLPPASRLLANIGIFVLLFFMLHGLRIEKLKKYSFFSSFSRGVLWIYATHLIIGFNGISYLRAQGITPQSALMVSLFGMLLLHYLVGVLVIYLKDGKAPAKGAA